MAQKTRSALVSFLSGLGEKVFRFLSGCEERRFLPGVSSWIKVGILELLVSAIGWLSAKSIQYPGPMCYAPPLFWNVLISDASITPNPTKGADSVTVSATARAANPNTPDARIQSANMRVVDDTTLVPMHPVDSVFDDTLETLEGKLYIGNLERETTWVEIRVNTSEGAGETQWLQLVVSEPDSTESEN